MKNISLKLFWIFLLSPETGTQFLKFCKTKNVKLNCRQANDMVKNGVPDDYKSNTSTNEISKVDDIKTDVVSPTTQNSKKNEENKIETNSQKQFIMLLYVVWYILKQYLK